MDFSPYWENHATQRLRQMHCCLNGWSRRENWTIWVCERIDQFGRLPHQPVFGDWPQWQRLVESARGGRLCGYPSDVRPGVPHRELQSDLETPTAHVWSVVDEYGRALADLAHGVAPGWPGCPFHPFSNQRDQSLDVEYGLEDWPGPLWRKPHLWHS